MKLWRNNLGFLRVSEEKPTSPGMTDGGTGWVVGSIPLSWHPVNLSDIQDHPQPRVAREYWITQVTGFFGTPEVWLSDPGQSSGRTVVHVKEVLP